jgi:light-regulated signal transduction histidine kinase (bacteriophytochrome)
MTGAGQDVTEARQAEEEIKRLNTELEQRVADRTAQLEASNRELEAFAYSVSHDLRAPLRSIDGFCKILLDDYGPQLDDEGKEYLQRIRKASQRLGQLIDDLLNLSRATRTTMRIEHVDLSDMALHIAEELRSDEPNRSAEFRIDLGAIARGDARLLQLVMQNLLDNAWKFSSKNEQARIEFGMTEEEGGRVFFVRDNGVGFDMKYADRLFTSFQRLHSPAQFPGSGIGLATVHRIVKRHGGTIWVKAGEGKGATFYFTL